MALVSLAFGPETEVAMCEAGRLVADFIAGSCGEPKVPELVGSLTTTIDGTWVVWAYKLAGEDGDRFVPLNTRGSPYPADAQADCSASGLPPHVAQRYRDIAERIGPQHLAYQRFLAMAELRAAPEHAVPDPSCTCGFYAVSETRDLPFPSRLSGPALSGANLVCLTVVLSGRVLAFEWGEGGILFRAARQTVVRVVPWPAGAIEALREPLTVAKVLNASAAGQGRPNHPDDPGSVLARPRVRQPFGAGPVRLALPSECARVAVADDPAWCGAEAEPAHRLPELVQT